MMISRIWLSVTVLFSVLICISLLSLCVLQPFLWFLINRQTRLIPGTKLYSEWLQPSVPILTQFYVFNLTNPIEFQFGHKPHVKQLGPYTYREKRLKLNISHNNGTITYKEMKWYYFDANLSNGMENDSITSVNLAFISIALKVNSMPSFIKRIIQMIESHFHEYLFITKSINELLWGYNDELLTYLSMHGFNLSSISHIGLFINRNNTLSDYVTINDGLYNQKMIGQIIQYHGKTTLTYWNSSTANMINGTDGTLFHSFLTKYDKPYIFASDICRSLQFFTESINKLHNLPVLKLTPMLDTFKSPKYYEKNKGFCLNWPNCYDDGVLDMSSCQPGAPVVVSQPHFLNANKSYQDAVDGISPTAEMNTIIYVEPNTGSIMKAQKKLQINILVKNDATFKQLTNISTTLLPLMFINESIQLNDTIIEQLTNALIQQPFIIQTILICIITLSLISLCSIISIHFYQNRQHTTYIQFIDNHQSNDVTSQSSLDVVNTRQQQQQEQEQQQTILNDLQENPIV
ncbi:hypothetical protein MN116_002597 [Schistosoma mekongi]|uniref:Scavenger receptor class B member 1 n=1 Tax=Schistosoma mekongi TaxID=38744 RepID=A0AAE1ZGN4_SCHME|nr:hypothetical protein MN116_002597 [Schistosoma mekongi]